MEKSKLNHFKNKLEKEKELLLEELNSMGQQDPLNPHNWNLKPEDINSREADFNKLADNVEQREEDTAVMNKLEHQLLDVNEALAKVEAGTYGVCEKSGEKIEEDRLEANPAARTSKAHMND